ncbi:MAG: permease [Synergistaceae bacterium]|jgi:uncharacterized membrane protein YraQ (UPF0718 family)|nr:permease [Synergistaceae bacterium]
MRIPVYVVTGFLGSGKTTFLNALLDEGDDISKLVVQFEAGEASLGKAYAENLVFSKKTLELKPETVVRRLEESLENGNFDEIWIEWNGFAPFSQLLAILLDPALKKFCKISKVLHVAEAAQLNSLIGRSGSVLLEQIANCDFAVLRNGREDDKNKDKDKNKEKETAKAALRAVNEGLPVYDASSCKNVYKELFEKRRAPLTFFFLSILLTVWLYIVGKPFLELAEIPVNKCVNVFLGIALQAVPFLLIGVHLSSAIEIFVSRSAIERRFPKTIGMGMLTAIASGFCLPVCDCASIPIFRSLVRKGVPLPAAVTFMMSAPVINPVVILSTYYAFSGNLRVVAERILLGVLCSVSIGLAVRSSKTKKTLLPREGIDALLCRCGCYESLGSVLGVREKIGLFFRHAQAEFFDVGKYLMVGILVSSIFQASGVTVFASWRSGSGLAISTAVLMLAGFMLSLCSSSDAVVARSFANQFPPGAVMGFLLFGPMMDVKNFMMLSHSFPKGFVVKLSIVAFAVCFAAVFVFFDFFLIM